MPEAVPRGLLDTAMREHEAMTYAELAGRIGRAHIRTERGADGRTYQIEIEAEWDDQPGGAVRVVGAIDDGSFRPFLPLSDEFIVAPDGSRYRPPR